MCALTYLLSHYLVAPYRTTRARLRRLAGSDTGATIGNAALSFLGALAGGLAALLDELQLTRHRLRLLARDEAGYTTQTVIMTALLAALAIAVGAIIYTKVINKANSINLDGNSGSQ